MNKVFKKIFFMGIAFSIHSVFAIVTISNDSGMHIAVYVTGKDCPKSGYNMKPGRVSNFKNFGICGNVVTVKVDKIVNGNAESLLDEQEVSGLSDDMNLSITETEVIKQDGARVPTPIEGRGRGSRR